MLNYNTFMLKNNVEVRELISSTIQSSGIENPVRDDVLFALADVLLSADDDEGRLAELAEMAIDLVSALTDEEYGTTNFIGGVADFDDLGESFIPIPAFA